MDKIALEGGINGLSDSDCTDWRDFAISELKGKYTFHNPMDFDCRGREHELRNQLVEFDEKGMASSNIALVMANKPSWGTGIAIEFCHSRNKEIIIICDSEKPSPWISHRASLIFKTIQGAVSFLKNR